MSDEPVKRDRRFDAEGAKFSTQRKVTYYVIALVASVIVGICIRGTITDVLNVYNTLLPIFAGVIGYWIGSSKGADDTRQPPKETQ